MLSVGEVLVFRVTRAIYHGMSNDAAQMHVGRASFRRDFDMRKHLLKFASLVSIALAVALFAPQRAAADDNEDPPSRSYPAPSRSYSAPSHSYSGGGGGGASHGGGGSPHSSGGGGGASHGSSGGGSSHSGGGSSSHGHR